MSSTLDIKKTGLLPFMFANRLEVGCDEAGRGCLAGPVVAAAVILDPKKPIKGLNDSKKLTEKARANLRLEIEKSALSWSVGICSPQEIDEINILNASFLAMHKALDQLSEPFDHILVDGNRFHRYQNIEHTWVIKGDAKFQSIAAASILAKEHRDDFMKLIYLEHPQYLWKKNKGYPTQEHRKAIEIYGSTPHHRLTFQLLPIVQTKLVFD
jgi:ribonuclease HII